MSETVGSALRVLPSYLGQHVLLSAAALALGALIGLSLALLAARRPHLRWPILAAASLAQTIPGLALLALFYPLLLGLSALTRSLVGVGFPALGFLPSLLALTLYAILPILRNGVTGLTGIDSDVLEAADSVGMTPRQRLWTVEVPLAAPVVMAGTRTAAVWTIGAATLSTSVGQTSLGNYIFSGLQTENWVLVLFGCVAASVLALAVDQLLGLIETGAAKRDRRHVLAGLGGLSLGCVAALLSLGGGGARPYVVGAKTFSEQFIMAEALSRRLQQAGARATIKSNLGSAVAFRALAGSEIDVYVDYSGTLWANVLARRDTPARGQMLAELATTLRTRWKVEMLGALGFENAYVLAMRADRAKALGIRTIGDLAPHAGRLVLGTDLEFLARPEWTALRQAYALNFADQRSFNPTFMYRAIDDGSADVITAFSSDGRIAAQNLVVLTDEKQVTPAYDAVLLIAPARAGDGLLRRALLPLVGRIDVERMRQANLSVDRDDDKVTPSAAAATLLEGLGLAK